MMTVIRDGNTGGQTLPMSKLAIVGAVMGLLSLIPCFCLTYLTGGVGLLTSALALMHTSGATPKARGKGVAVVGLVLSIIGIGILSTGLSPYESKESAPKSAEEQAYESANSFIATHSGSVGSGNTPQASGLATTYSALLETRVRDSFTGFKDSAMALSDNKQLVYCHLTDDTVVFLVHVPELRRYDTDDLRDYLREIAWDAACEVTEGEELNLVIGLRGSLLYGSKMEGPNTGSMPAAQKRPTGTDFHRYFTVAQPTRTLTFKSQGDTVAPQPDEEAPQAE